MECLLRLGGPIQNAIDEVTPDAEEMMVRNTLAGTLLVATVVIAGCTTAGPRASSRGQVLPILFNDKSSHEVDYRALGDP